MSVLARVLAATLIAVAALVLVPVGPAVAAALVASPDDPRQAETVSLLGTGWKPVVDLVPGATTTCELRLDDLAALEPSCLVDDEGDLTGGLTVPTDAALGPHTILACLPSCSRPVESAEAVVTVRPPLTTVPLLRGQTYGEVLVSLDAQGLSLDPTVTEPDDRLATVVDQSPAAGSEVERDSLVRATFAPPTDPGQDQVAVPYLTGLGRGAARAAVEARGLTLALAAGGDRRGRVEAQQPAAQTLVDPGTTVTVTLAARELRLVAVPDVVGLEVDRARRLVESSGLILRVASNDDGRVATQNPVAGTLVRAGTVVGVAVESGTGPGGWVVLAGAGLVLLVLGALGTILTRGVRRHGRRWVRGHVEVVPGVTSTDYQVVPEGPSHDLRLTPRPSEPATELEEVAP